MFQLKPSKTFRKKYDKLIENNKSIETKINKALELLAQDPSYPSLKTHKVNLPTWGEVCSSSATGDIRIIWRQIDGELILLLLDIGGHSGGKGVYK